MSMLVGPTRFATRKDDEPAADDDAPEAKDDPTEASGDEGRATGLARLQSAEAGVVGDGDRPRR